MEGKVEAVAINAEAVAAELSEENKRLKQQVEQLQAILLGSGSQNGPGSLVSKRKRRLSAPGKFPPPAIDEDFEQTHFPEERPSRPSVVPQVNCCGDRPGRPSVVPQVDCTGDRPSRLSLASEVSCAEDRPGRLSLASQVSSVEERMSRPSVVPQLNCDDFTDVKLDSDADAGSDANSAGPVDQSPRNGFEEDWTYEPDEASERNRESACGVGNLTTCVVS